MPGIVDKSSPAFIQSSADAKKAFDAVGKRLEKVIKAIRVESEPALLAIAKEIERRALPLTPIDTGALRESSFTDSRTTSEGAEAVVGFGKGGEPPYAVFVHEIQANHESPTQWKFLQAAAEQVEKEIPEMLAAMLRKKLGL